MKLIQALETVRAPHPENAKAFPVSLVCGFNPLHFETFLNAEMRLRWPDRKPEIRSGSYGDFWGNLQRAKEASPDLAVIILEWSDLDPRLGIRTVGAWTAPALRELPEFVRTRTDWLESAVRDLAQKCVVAVSLPTLPLPPINHTPGWRANHLELELRSRIAELAARLVDIANVRILSSQRLDELSPLAQRLDVRSEVNTGFPYHLDAASTLAKLLVSLSADDAPKKGLITDLDDTLWRGIVGEVGAAGVSWDLDHRSHMHGLYQRFLDSLASTGVLIGVASKNNPAFVDEAFQRKDMILPAASVFPMEVHWNPKSESVGRILKAWNVSADSVVFVDDSPSELAEVQSAYPGLECVLFPAMEPHLVYGLLERLRDLFGKSSITAEDSLRLQSLRSKYSSDPDTSSPAHSIESFLREAESELTVSLAKEPLDPRALELINKTNQFNLNGRRFTASEWQRYLADSNSFLQIVSYQDRYGPLGKIAVLAGRHERHTLRVDTWVMSCRAFGRRIEYGCLDELFDKFAATQIEFDFCATDRNGPLREFLAHLLGENPTAFACLSREMFLQRRLETFHRTAELIRE